MLAQIVPQFNAHAAQQHLTETVSWLEQAVVNNVAAHEVERHILRQVLAMGHALFDGFLQAVGPGDQGETVVLPNGRIINRLPEGTRRLLTIFGESTVSRFGYGKRVGQKIEWVPTDQRLQLPEGELSYLLQEWDQMLDIEHPFGKVAQSLHDLLGLDQSVDTLEHNNRQMAQGAAAFRQQQPTPDPAAEGEILVASEDNKGIPMVRPTSAAPAGAHRNKGEKANKTQMACIGCVYTVNPHVRTAEELIAALFRDPGRRPQGTPEACQKRYWAELTRTVAGKVVRGQDEVFRQMAGHIKQRRKPGQKLVNLCDGQRSLETDRTEHLPIDENTVDILDLMHVLPRLWEAAHLFHAEGSDEASSFVREHLPYVLNGLAKDVISELRQMGTQHRLRGAKAKRLKKLCAFLERNLHRMKYDEYLKAGYPIATGVIEGACRHVIKDRMERAGMRWTVAGAQAMLELRTIAINGEWKAFIAYRIEQENKRLYPYKDMIETIPSAIAA
jgi:hypothetical protein